MWVPVKLVVAIRWEKRESNYGFVDIGGRLSLLLGSLPSLTMACRVPILLCKSILCNTRSLTFRLQGFRCTGLVGGGGLVQPGNRFVSFRLGVRACVGAVWLLGGKRFPKGLFLFSFSLLDQGTFPLALCAGSRDLPFSFCGSN